MLKPKSRAYQKEQKNFEEFFRFLPNSCKRSTSEDITAMALRNVESTMRDLRKVQAVLHELAVRLPGVVLRGPYPTYRGKLTTMKSQAKVRMTRNKKK